MIYFADHAFFFLCGAIGFFFSLFFLQFFNVWFFFPHVSLMAWSICVAVLVCGLCVALRSYYKKNVSLLSHASFKRFDLYGVGVLVLIAFIIRWFAFDDSLIGVDASYHLEAARDFLQRRWPSYDRALLYSASIAFFQWLFGSSLTASIFPGLIVNIATIVVLWFGITFFLNKRVAYIYAFLLTILPWHIAQSTTVRMYGLLQLVFLIFIFLVYWYFVEHKHTRFDLVGSVVFFAGLSVLCIVALHMHLLTLGVIPLLYLFFVGYLFFMITSRRLGFSELFAHRITFFVAGGSLILGGFYFVFPEFFLSSFTNFETVARPLPHHSLNYVDWFLGRFGVSVTMALLAVAVGFTAYTRDRRERLFLIFIHIIFYGYLFQLSQLYTTHFATRYAFHIAPLFVVFLAVGVDVLVRIFVRERYAVWGIVCALCFFTVTVITLVRHERLVFSRGESSQEILYPYEIRYPFALVIRRIPIQKDDYVISLHPGMWRFFQSVSDHIFDINVYNKLYRALENESVVISRFLDLIKNSSRGYYLTDTFRQEKWECGKTLVPCFLRTFVKAYFTHREEWDAGELLVYEWKTLHSDAVLKDSESFHGKSVGKYFEYALFDTFLFVRPLPALLNLARSRGLLLVASIDGSNVFILIPHEAVDDRVYRYSFSGGNIDWIGIVDEGDVRVISVSE